MHVLGSEDLVALIASFRDGLLQATFELKRACRGCSVHVERAPYEAYHARFQPWFARYGTSQLLKLCQVHLFVYALDYANMDVLRWFHTTHNLAWGRAPFGWDLRLLDAYFCPDIDSRYYFRTVGSSTLYAHPQVVTQAAIRNHVEILAISLEIQCNMRSVWIETCRHGHVAVAEFAQRAGFIGWSYQHLNVAARHGHLDLIRHFHEMDFNGFNAATIRAAVDSGNLALVQFLLAHRLEVTLEDAMCQAAASSQLDILRWLVTQPTAPFYMRKVLMAACANLCNDVLAYLEHEHGLQPPPAETKRLSRRRQRQRTS
ncbi:hypothetical protein SPRG_07168 [Saprolegnia parasitica CBS 223.65]|uniref:Uncharacterized protein n=1 Tax=Saprolegnia parasitica (strain CBS 223.65) TaxID=695850 RepID=A0A067CFD1_SAPPC|nr:hypothetical protein SPRG_07168 [Saprolegnia parasitica CBS 223.65]KDO27895.1 hypothetical protein SPRG_07168 [Saprolegnia parasitica CBS 223.65]|eukprot:XP_012201352.1 hypothetical protein SPRG_07168 [Saprolegnia parasitica CBS 223.65]